jgi:uncharacterized membrane protein YdjX (TVP38/TMEM64 family)
VKDSNQDYLSKSNNITAFMKILELIKKNISKIILLIILFFGILAAFYLKSNGYLSNEKIIEFSDNNKILAPFVFIAVYPVLMALFIPTLPMNMTAGFLWGPVYGTIFSILGASIGISIDFLVARYIGREFFTKKLSFKTWKWILNQVETKGWRVVIFIRINPVFPTNIFSYLFGITTISFREYFISSVVAMSLPAVILASFGSSAKEFFVAGNVKGMITGIIIAVASLVILFLIRPVFNKMFKNVNRPETDKIL